MAVTTDPRLLVKLPLGATRMSFGLAGRPFQLTPLIDPIPGAGGGLGLAGTPAQQWFLAQTDKTIDPINVWDLAHQTYSQLPEATEIEPDLEQKWLYENPTPLMLHGATFSADAVCQFTDQNDRGGATPKGPEFGWHLRDDFSQLRAARIAVEGAAPVRIAHLDTGYDPKHVTRPMNLVLERNLVDGQAGNDAHDPAPRGLLRNPGHGPGTLSILAGNKLIGVTQAGPLMNEFLGGCPEAEIVPIRIANSVVLFRTSAFIQAIDYALKQNCQVLSMSMGGLASSAWADIVNLAYDRGLVMVTAAGNNFGGFPVTSIVYPARFHRVLAACGVMEDGRPYHNLAANIMQGNIGPREKMDTALSAYTPNMPWAELGCDKIVDMDGQGTSAATPQIAAAAALWLMKHNPQYPEPWMRVEAVRKALFDSAKKGDAEFLGQGILRANDALAIQPALANQLSKQPLDTASLPFLKLLFGFGVAPDPKQRLLLIEAAQLAQSKIVEDVVAESTDPRRIAAAIAEHPQCSNTLKEALGAQAKQERPSVSVLEPGERSRGPKQTSPPANRRLRTYAFDPSLSLDLDAKVINLTTVQIPWEAKLEPGPVGEYLEVVDVDPSSACAYEPVDLSDPNLLAQDGHAPSEGNPQFHQQMVYAVAMRTIKNFETALGRVALWSPRRIMTKDGPRDQFVQKLRLYPHALRQPNAYYSSERKAVLFGYFPASRTKPGRNLPGSTVFTCLSHDIVAHEMTHALLDGMHPRFSEPTNADVLALHEAFADIVALFQHFSFPEALLHQIRKTRGDLAKQSLLGELAQQFGEAIGQYGALRDAIGTRDEKGQWQPKEPKTTEYEQTTEPHKRGSILVAAVFEAFLAIYKRRVEDLIRIASGGTGVLPQGEIHPDLANRLAREAAATAQDVLNICIRALDYCPPVDITFGEYLRALVTADWDLSSSDDRGYRVAFIEAFRRRGIYPEGVRTLSEDSLRWSPLGVEMKHLDKLFDRIDMNWDLYSNREEAFTRARDNRLKFHTWVTYDDSYTAELAKMLGLDPALKYEVHSVRPARRTKYDSTMFTDLVVEVTQRKKIPYDPKRPEDTFTFRGGCTVLLDVRQKAVRYVITKSVTSERRLARQREFLSSPAGASLHATYFGDPRRFGGERFALLHQGAFEEN